MYRLSSFGGLSLLVALHPVDCRSHILGPSQYREGPAVRGSRSFLVILNLGLACISTVLPDCDVGLFSCCTTWAVRILNITVSTLCNHGNQRSNGCDLLGLLNWTPLLNSHGKLVASTMKCNVPAEHGGEFCKMTSFSLDYSPALHLKVLGIIEG